MPKKREGGGLVELAPDPDLTTADGLRKHTQEVTQRLNELIKREAQGGGIVVSEDEWNTLEGGFNKLAARTAELDTLVKAQASALDRGDTTMVIEKASLRLQTPEDVHKAQRDYYNVTVLRWDELAGLSHLGAATTRALGLSDNVRTAAHSSSGMELRDLVTRFQNLNDEMLVLDTVMHPDASRGRVDLGARLARMQTYRSWPEYSRLVNRICEAMKVDRAFNEGTSTSGLNWVPTVLSAQLMDLVQVELKVAGLFPAITMTSKTLDWPVLGADLVPYLMSEAVTDGSDTPISASTATTNKVTFTAVKMGVRTFASSEIIEDSIIPMVPFILANAAKVLARGIEDAIINGESAGVTMDGATFNPAGGVRRAWNGLRFHSLMTASYPAKIDMGNAVPSTAKLLDVQLNMGVYGASPAPLAWITGFRGLKGLMKMSEMLTLEKFGPQATILSGQVGAVFGSPVILSEFVTDKNATGVHDAVAANNNRGSILCVHRSTYGMASRRAININGSSDRYIEQDQTVFVGTVRADFKPFYIPSATVTPVGILYNIA